MSFVSASLVGMVGFAMASESQARSRFLQLSRTAPFFSIVAKFPAKPCPPAEAASNARHNKSGTHTPKMPRGLRGCLCDASAHFVQEDGKAEAAPRGMGRRHILANSGCKHLERLRREC